MTKQDHNDQHNISGAQFTQPADDFQVRSASSGVLYDFEEVQPIGGAYVGVDDSLEIWQWVAGTGNLAEVNVRMLGLDGLIHPFKFQVIDFSQQAIIRNRFQLMEGWILSATVRTTGTPTSSGYLYAVLGLSRSPFGAGNLYNVLCAGYAGTDAPLCYPNAPLQRSTDGQGILHSVVGGVPAAGVDWNVNVSTNARWRLISLVARLTTSATVANRTPSLFLRDASANGIFDSPQITPQAASLVVAYSWGDSCAAVATVGGVANAPLPGNCYLAQNMQIFSSTPGIQAGDQWTAPVLLIQEWQDNT
jgi:hypothetical protein